MTVPEGLFLMRHSYGLIRTLRDPFVVIALALLLSACGGGGGPSGPPLGTTSFSTSEDTDLSAQLTVMGTDTATFAVSSNPTSGTLVSFSDNGAFVYRPNADFFGNDSFTITATGSNGGVTTGTVTITVTPVNDPPRAVNDVLRADDAALASIDILGNDQEPDGEPMTVTIEENAPIGTVSLNSDNTVRIDGLPPNFRGVTRFRYSVRDASGLSSNLATVAVFVGTDPFRVTFAGVSASGSPEVYMTDFVSRAWNISRATEGNMRLRGFAVSENGATVVYRRQDVTNANNSDLTLVRTADTSNQIRITLPGNYRLIPDVNNRDQFVVSPNGQWIAVLAGAPDNVQVLLVNVDSPTQPVNVTPAGMVYASQPRFSADSSYLFFLASPAAGGPNRKGLYRVAVDAVTPVLMSQAPTASTPVSDDVRNYSVSPDGLRIALQAFRGGFEGVYFVNPTQPRVEQRLNAEGHFVINSTVGLPPFLGGASDGSRVAYTALDTFRLPAAILVFGAEVDPVPSTREIAGSSARGVLA